MKRAILLFLLWSVSGLAATTEVRQDRTTRVLVGRSTIVSSNFLGQTTQPLSQFSATTSAELAGVLSDETGSGGGFVRATSPTLTTPDLGTPSAVDLNNATNLPIATGVSGLGTGIASWLATPSSANLASALTDETGTAGSVVFSASPTFTGPIRSADGTAAAPTYSFTSDPDTGIYSAAADTLGLSAGGTVRAMIDGNGLGVFTLASPGIPLNVVYSTNTSALIAMQNVNSGNSAYAGLFAYSDGGNVSLRSYSAAHSTWPDSALLVPSSLDGQFVFYSGSSTMDWLWYANGLERMRLSDNGEFRISTPGALSQSSFLVNGSPPTGGTATTTKPLALIETSGATSTGWNTSGTMLGVNSPSGFAGMLLDLHSNGNPIFQCTVGGVARLPTASGQLQFTSDTILRRAASANLALGAADAASPVAQTISVQNVASGTTDTAGAHTTYAASRSTGAGVGGGHLFQVSPYSTTGSSQNTLVNAFRILSGTSQSGSFTKYGSSSSGPEIYQISGTSIGYTASGTGLGFYSFQAATGDESSFLFNGTTRTQTSGAANHVSLVRSFAPTSGTGTYTHLLLTPTINQTGGANGITYGLRINPSLVAAADFRALQIDAGNVRLASATEINWNGDLPVGRDAPATLQLGTDAASPVNQSLKAADGSGTDKDGGDLTLSGGQPTGTGRGGDTVLRTGLTGSTGSSLGALSTRQFDSAKWVDLTESTETQFATVTCGTGKYLGAQLVVTVNADDASDFQALTSTLNVNAVNKAGTITKTVTQVDGTTAASAGTLTATYVVTDNGSGVLGIKVNAVSSLTQTQLRAKWSITALNSDDVATVTPN